MDPFFARCCHGHVFASLEVIFFLVYIYSYCPSSLHLRTLFEDMKLSIARLFLGNIKFDSQLCDRDRKLETSEIQKGMDALRLLASDLHVGRQSPPH